MIPMPRLSLESFSNELRQPPTTRRVSWGGLCKKGRRAEADARNTRSYRGLNKSIGPSKEEKCAS